EEERSAITLYVHVPFCCRRCAYCGTYRVMEREPDYDPFIRAVAREWELLREEHPEIGDVQVEAVYVGGGMPSLFGAPRLAALLSALRVGPGWVEGCEVTLEAWPGSLDPESGRALLEGGFNRLHVRVQSFHDPELVTLDRGYTAQQARDGIAAQRAAGFDCLSMDLRYGIPGQTLDSWTATLKDAVALDCEHLTCNQLGRREELLHDRLLRGGFHESPLDEHLLAQYQAAARRLVEAGYEQYEVESFARRGNVSRYASSVWERRVGYGLGPGAHSFDGAIRWRNAKDLGAYLGRLLDTGRLPPRERYRLSAENAAQEEVYLGLRRARGLRWETIARHVGEAGRSRLERRARVLANQGFVEVTPDGLRLRRQAYFVADSIVLELIRTLEDATA
ncbi:MAG: coproporphyrinogen-III oxidase family protein, partial [Candidatus Eisenbacteria bacterium]